ncbi:hypothetical protein [uncultured Mediterranean phage uvMED]|jgi:hypothetical protein|nr:hypothetical protein [uncultured Mediterranean phage uvMED]BAQ87627.1 hypothetical protein [uncultured Mediterranean phage uvMED]BAR17593.1 hypothetical protein [uncultured Mediterranean phage uvMED]|tara:strand:+ start:4958 stop:5167 length:210 start_codon:yes stop_codon:yes gene_type:complete
MAYHSIEKLRKYNHGALKKLRIAVKLTHMKDLPKEGLTDRECDRVLEALNPVTLEKLYKLAVDHDIVNL